MKLTVLLDNNTFIDRYFLGEPGLSFFIEDDGTKVLFDAGYSGIFADNAQKLGVSLIDLDYLVLSHGHLDHTWGLEHLLKLYSSSETASRPKMVSHPLVFIQRTDGGEENFGSRVSEKDISKYFDIKYSREPVWLTERLVYLGEIKRRFRFENKTPIGKIMTSAEGEDDYLMDDSALAYISDKGLVVITGCSHSGICNIIEQAMEICGTNEIYDVIGGFHLLSPTAEQLNGILSYIKGLGPSRLHPCHCTSLHSKIALAQAAPVFDTGVGLVLEY
jgi:7,8-dihydropterin-6-yl-methyl-4-(beta-D-ribofuranosyl)aminobenzene 5'-phosphate synthase